MIVNLKAVIMDGTTPATGDALVPYVQHLDGSTVALPSIPAGIDVEVVIECVGQDDVAYDMTGWVGVLTARRSSVSADPVFANAVTFSTSTGSSFITHTDTVDEIPRTLVYDFFATSPADKSEQPIPQSHLVITAAVGNVDESITPVGPDMILCGLPAPTDDSEIGRAVVLLSRDPFLMGYDTLGATRLLVSSLKIADYTAIAGYVVLVDPTDGAFAITLPTAVGIGGYSIIVKNAGVSTNAVTVGTTSGQAIDGASTYVMNVARQSMTFVSDGADWMII